VDLAGGTLDCWPLHVLVGDCVTINLAIDVFSQVHLIPTEGKTCVLDIEDLNYKKVFSNLNEIFKCSDQELLLVRAVLQYFKPLTGFTLKTKSQSPVGAGLGGSSSLCISLIKAFLRWEERSMSTLQMVELAHNIEAQVLNKPTGTQDYVPAIDGGLHFIHYTLEGIRLEKRPVPMEGFFENLFLVYTGKAHHSGINNWQVIKSILDGDQRPLLALKEIASISKRLEVACRAEKWDLLPGLFSEEYSARIQLSEGFSSPEIEKLAVLAKNCGAKATKICGAGGGGSVLLWAEPEAHARLSKVCKENGFQPLQIQPVL
jgi:D-glycero-alpha-D-manno-heptose-7-phosphate kinase